VFYLIYEHYLYNKKGKLAPIWPFFGFLGECALLAAIITVNHFFKKKNDSKLSDKSK
jgi:hypothetical protein